MALDIKESLFERRGYEDSVKAYRDINNAINTAKAVDNARKMKADGMSAELISKYTSLSIDEIEKL